MLLISTGNIRSVDLETLFFGQLAAVVGAFVAHDYVELTRTKLIIHQ